MKDKFYWRLELSYAIIYWSFAYSFLFLALIFSLEKAGFNWKALIVFVIFLFFLYFDHRRFFQFTDKGHLLSYSRFWKNRKFTSQECDQIDLFENAILISLQQQKIVILFKEKERDKVFSVLTATYAGKIICHEKKYNQYE